jgi:hypothetical protein
MQVRHHRYSVVAQDTLYRDQTTQRVQSGRRMITIRERHRVDKWASLIPVIEILRITLDEQGCN